MSPTPARANADQIEYWNGEVGQKWVRRQEKLDQVLAPLTSALLERAAPRAGERVLDVGCGCGTTALALAERVGMGADGRILAVDVSRPMLERARERAGAIRAPIEWIEADASTHRFAPPVDLLCSRFGTMFFDRPVAAFANLRWALAPGGRLAMLCWRGRDENAWVAVPLAAVLRVVPPPTPADPEAPGPFAFADAGRVERILAEAGYAGIASERCDARLMVGEGRDGSDAEALDEAVRFVLEIGPVSALLNDVEAQDRERARAVVLEALRPRARNGRVELGASCWLYRAINPAGRAAPDGEASGA